MANQCRAWSEALDPFEYALSSHADAATGATQMAVAIRADLFDIDCAFYIAGPAEFAAALQAELAAAAVPAAQVHVEVMP
jgi:ferredoxin-NADP reductase